MKKTITLITIVGAALAASCASTPQQSQMLEHARAEVDALQQQPLAASAAAQDLDQARKSLKDADDALAQKRPPQEVDHLAFLASRHAEIGEARITEAQAREKVAHAGAERDSVLLNARTQEAAQAQANAQQAQANAQQAQAATAAANAETERMKAQLADLQAKQTDRGMVVTLGDVLFDTNSASLKPGANLTLDKLSQVMKSNTTLRVLIEGNTDSTGSAAYNEELSQRRAQSVANALQDRGIDSGRVETKGLGPDFPVATNATPSGRQQNRRVEIVFSDPDGKFAQGSNRSALR